MEVLFVSSRGSSDGDWWFCCVRMPQDGSIGPLNLQRTINSGVLDQWSSAYMFMYRAICSEG